MDFLNVESKELAKVRGHENLKICSVSSSARLCFLYLWNKEGVEFESHLLNPTGGGNAAQPDAKIGNTYYEFKCQEIVDGEGEPLKYSYGPLLQEFFGIKIIKINEYERTITGYLPELGIDYKEDYDKTHFNVKQLFTHLIAIAKKHPKEDDLVKLQYVFFEPDAKKQSTDTAVVYEELKAEIKAIWNSESLRFFKGKNRNIGLPDPIFVPVSERCFAQNPADILDCLKKRK